MFQNFILSSKSIFKKNDMDINFLMCNFLSKICYLFLLFKVLMLIIFFLLDSMVMDYGLVFAILFGHMDML